MPACRRLNSTVRQMSESIVGAITSLWGMIFASLHAASGNAGPETGRRVRLKSDMARAITEQRMLGPPWERTPHPDTPLTRTLLLMSLWLAGSGALIANEAADVAGAPALFG